MSFGHILKHTFYVLFLFNFIFLSLLKAEQDSLEPSMEAVPQEIMDAMNMQPTNNLDKSLGGYLPDDFMEGFVYDPRGKRDPFLPNLKGSVEDKKEDFPLSRYNIEQLTVNGIVWNVHRPQAMIRDPSGTVHVLSINDRIGRNNGYIAVIREGEVVIVEEYMSEGKKTYVTRSMQIVR